MSAAFPELNLKLSARRWSCVLDPTLALSGHGLQLARQASEVMQLWLVREFWHILDSSEFFSAHPEALVGDRWPADKLDRSLKAWDRARLDGDMAELKLCWVGDGPSESALPEGTDARLLQGYETLAQSLGRRIRSVDPMSNAMRDAAALAAALGHTAVLTCRVPSHGTLPPICSALEGWDIPCREIEAGDPMATLEREHVRRLLVHAGLSHLLWAGLQLAVVRLLLPNATLPLAVAPTLIDDLASDDEPAAASEPPSTDLWAAAQAFWHRV